MSHGDLGSIKMRLIHLETGLLLQMYTINHTVLSNVFMSALWLSELSQKSHVKVKIFSQLTPMIFLKISKRLVSFLPNGLVPVSLNFFLSSRLLTAY